MLFVRGESL